MSKKTTKDAIKQLYSDKNKDNTIIAFISDYPQAGKTTSKNIFKEICTNFMYNTQGSGHILSLSFATPLKEMLKPLLRYIDNNPDYYINGAGKETKLVDLFNLTPRKMMQTLGTEWGRTLHPNIWIKLMEHRIKRNKDTVILIDDCRFENEYQMLKEQGAFFIRIIRPDKDFRPKTLIAKIKNYLSGKKQHSSEGALSKKLVDFTVMNIGSKQDLEESLGPILKEIAKNV